MRVGVIFLLYVLTTLVSWYLSLRGEWLQLQLYTLS